jgi:hypothetical protein
MEQWFESLLFPSSAADFRTRAVSIAGKDSSQCTVLFGPQEEDSELKVYFAHDAASFWTQTVSRTGEDLHSTKYSLQCTAGRQWIKQGTLPVMLYTSGLRQ